MDGTLVSNIRVACVGATAAKYLSRKDSETIGFIGSGIQARNTLLGMKSVRPSLKVCKVSSQFDYEEKDFVDTGLSYIDIMLANTMYEKAAAKGIGTVLPLQAMGEFEHDLVGKIVL